MTIEQFFRGCFDCGYEASVCLMPDGEWRISVYESGNVFYARHKGVEAASWDAAVIAFEAEPWGPSTKTAIAQAQELGGWK